MNSHCHHELPQCREYIWDCVCLYTCVGPTVTPRSCPRRSCVMREWLLLNLNCRRKWRSSSPLQLFPQRYIDLKPELFQSYSTRLVSTEIAGLFKKWLPWCCSNSNVVYDASIHQQDTAGNGAVKEDETVRTVDDVVKTATVVSHTPSDSQSNANEPPELLTNEIIEEKGKRHGWPGGSVYLNLTCLFTSLFRLE